MCPKYGRRKGKMLEAFLWGITGGLLFLGWFFRLTQNHYQRGYAHGYERAKALHGKKDFK